MGFFMKRIDLTLLLGLFIAVVLTSFSGFAAEAESVRGQVLRLHILANSDDESDQALKYAIRDRILAESADVFAGENPAEARRLAARELTRFERIARQVIAESGYTYSASASIVNMYFSTTVYDGVVAPAGWYDAVRITIGEGSGQNWWCIMFPPMCLPAASGEQCREVRQSLGQLGQPGHPRYTPRFAVIELVEDLRNLLGSREEIKLGPLN